MEEIVQMGDGERRLDGARAELPPRHQRIRCPFEVMNTFLSIICLACVAIVVYDTLHPPQNTDKLVIMMHADVPNTMMKGKVNLVPEEKKFFKNNSIIIPCDGIYLVHVQMASNQKTWKVRIVLESENAKWKMSTIEFNTTALLVKKLRKLDRIFLETTENANVTLSESFLAIFLFHLNEDETSCRKHWNR